MAFALNEENGHQNMKNRYFPTMETITRAWIFHHPHYVIDIPLRDILQELTCSEFGSASIGMTVS